MERLWMLVLAFPGPCRALGGALISVSLTLGSLGWQLSKGLARATRFGARDNIETPKTLAEAYPGFPTWFIPETWPGFSLLAAAVVLGVALAYL